MPASSLLSPNAPKPRAYQEAILGTAAKKNTLVVLPTGLGKTYIAALLAMLRIQQHPTGKIVILAPTKPLTEQHRTEFQKLFTLNEDEFGLFTGALPPSKRKGAYQDAQFIFATPQVIQNDLITGTFSFQDASLVVFDEAHRASGEYPYGFIAQKYAEQAANPRLLGLTASPGTRADSVNAICQTLHLETIESRIREDTDVSPYVKTRTFEWVTVELPNEFKRVHALLEGALKDELAYLKKGGVLQTASPKSVRKRQLLQAQGELGARAAQEKELYPYLSALAATLKLYHALELLETQGLGPLEEYFKKLSIDSTQAAARIRTDARYKAAQALTKSLCVQGVEHPKLEKLLTILQNTKTAIVFANYRSSVNTILAALEANQIPADKLIGQAKEGQTQKTQTKRLDHFRAGKFRVLVCTSIGEEGLDLPAVERVIFYEPVPSAIRSIQRAGRTARHAPGKVTILATKGTRDEAHYWASRAQEKRMHAALKLPAAAVAQRTLQTFTPQPDDQTPEIVIFADTRESASGILKHLSSFGAAIRLKALHVADFQCSDRIGVERKTIDDFLQSMLDGRLLTQARELASTFEKPLLLLEGSDLYTTRNVHPNAIRGALAALSIDFGIPVIPTRDVEDSASFLYALAKREQTDNAHEVQLRGSARKKSTSEQQQFIIESLPHTGPKLAKRLLEHFETVETIFTASELELTKIPKLGDKKAKEIRGILTKKYNPEA